MTVAVEVGRKGRLILEIIARAEAEGRTVTEYGACQASGFKPRRFHHVVGYLHHHGLVTRNPLGLTDAGREALQ